MINILRLKAKLKEKGMTQKDLANEMGINPATLNKKINEVSGETLSIKEAECMGKALGLTKYQLQNIFFHKVFEETQINLKGGSL